VSEASKTASVGGNEAGVECATRLELTAVAGLPIISAGDDLSRAIGDALEGADVRLRDGDVVVVASKVVSRAEGRFVDLARVDVSKRAAEVAAEVDADPRLIELILREGPFVSRASRGVLVVRHRLGFVVANAGIDRSNAAPIGAPDGTGPWVVLLPESPDDSAERIRSALAARSGARIGVVITDSFGRPFRLGTVGAAIGIAGLPALYDQRGKADLFGRSLEHTITAFADQVAAAADLVAGQAAERRAIVHIRGLSFPSVNDAASALLRKAEEDLYA
jgi:coenzyme F420-0:L-glutamate ligase/coenzyme F420-1:gamma-L-glutamate ligase